MTPQDPSGRRAADKPRVMGIVNVTPDSFSDGGRFDRVEAAVAQVHRLVAEGAAFVDIGGESTRPGFTPVTLEEELSRVMPVLDGLGPLPVPVSIDTTKSEVARQALLGGASIVNDIWGLQRDPAMAGVIASAGAGAILMHNRAAPDERIDIADDMMRFFDTSLAIAARAGIDRTHLILDPGIGFGKTPRQQLQALAAIPRLLAFGLPVLVGLSRKSFLGRLTGSHVDARLTATVAANLAARTLGASIFRVHDVAEHVAAFAVSEAIREAAGSHETHASAEVVLSLGSNIGDKAGFIREALALLQRDGTVRDLVVSSLYRTAPWGDVPQDWFVNACAVGVTDLSPHALLERVKAIERAIGRTDSVRWGPRVIDIDIVDYAGAVVATPDLTLPHKEALNRAFVLVPLAEIRPDRRIGGVTLRAAIDRLGDGTVVPLGADTTARHGRPASA